MVTEQHTGLTEKHINVFLNLEQQEEITIAPEVPAKNKPKKSSNAEKIGVVVAKRV